MATKQLLGVEFILSFEDSYPSVSLLSLFLGLEVACYLAFDLLVFFGGGQLCSAVPHIVNGSPQDLGAHVLLKVFTLADVLFGALLRTVRSFHN